MHSVGGIVELECRVEGRHEDARTCRSRTRCSSCISTSSGARRRLSQLRAAGSCATSARARRAYGTSPMSRRLWREQLALIGGPSETGLDLRWLRCMGGHEFAHLRTHRFLVQGGDVLLPKPANERTSLHVWFIGRTRTRLRSADVRASAATPAWPSGIYSMIPLSYTRSSPGSLPAAMRSAQSPESLDLAG